MSTRCPDYMYLRGVKVTVKVKPTPSKRSLRTDFRDYPAHVRATLLNKTNRVPIKFPKSAIPCEMHFHKALTEITLQPRFTVQFREHLGDRRIREIFSELAIADQFIRPLSFATNLFEVKVPGGSSCDALKMANELSEAPPFRDQVRFAEPHFDQLGFSYIPYVAQRDESDGTNFLAIAKAARDAGLRRTRTLAAPPIRIPAPNEVTIAVVDQFFGSPEHLAGANVVHRGYFDDNLDYRTFSGEQIGGGTHGTYCARLVHELHQTGHLALLSMASIHNRGTQATLAKCIAKAVDLDREARTAGSPIPPVSVLSCSVGNSRGGYFPMQSVLKLAIDYAALRGREEKGIPIVWAAQKKNDRIAYTLDEVNNYHRVISVGSIGANDQPHNTKSGKHLELMAPPGKISGRNQVFLETSFAAPQVAAMAALIIERHPQVSARTVRAMLRHCTRSPRDFTASPGTHDERYGYGILDWNTVHDLDPADHRVVSMQSTLEGEQEAWLQLEAARQ